MSTATRDVDDRERPLTKDQLAVALAIDAFGIKAWRLGAPAEQRTPADIRELRKRGIGSIWWRCAR
jgi:hypothetical protein